MAKGLGKITAIIVLPIEYNADEGGRRRPIEDEKYVETADDIAKEFGGGTFFRFPKGQAQGFWWGKGILFRDELAAVEVDVPDTATSREWLRKYVKEILLRRFEQEAIYIKFVGPIEQMIVIREVIRE